MSFLVTTALFIGVLAVLVLVHEWGHFILAKKAGIQVDEFGFGFPPKLFGKKWNGTLYTLNLIPLGGFVKIKGVGEETKSEDSAASFSSKPFYIKGAILSAGIMMNLVLAWVLFSIVFALGVDTTRSAASEHAIISNERVWVTQVLESSPAAEAGLQAGDELTRVNGITVHQSEEVNQVTTQNEPVLLTVKHGDDEINVELMPKDLESNGQVFHGIGVGLESIVTVRYSILDAVVYSAKVTVQTVWQILSSLYTLISAALQGDGSTEDLTGPVGIAVLTAQIAQKGAVPFLQFIALLSIHIAVFNLLPIPALDGGRLLFAVIERIRHKPVAPTTEAIIHNIGFMLLLLLVILVTVKDIVKLPF